MISWKATLKKKTLKKDSVWNSSNILYSGT